MAELRASSIHKSASGLETLTASVSSCSIDDELRLSKAEVTTDQSQALVDFAPLHEETSLESARNWSQKQKWTTILMASAFGFITPMASSMLAPALPAIAADLAITNKELQQMVLSVFVLAYGFGPLLIGPLSEVYGRVPVMQLSSAFFLVFHLACGFAQTSQQILVFRFLAGIGASAPQSLGGGIVADCFSREERGAAMRTYTLWPMLGSAIGPIIGGIITERTTWRWVFWSLCIADAVVQVLAVFLMRESWQPRLLEKQSKKTDEKSSPLADSPSASKFQDLSLNLIRAVKMLGTQPVIVVVAIYKGFILGMTYLMLSTFAELYTSPRYYNESVQNASLHYIALALGYIVGTHATTYFGDWLYRRLKTRYNTDDMPEYHLPAMVPATILLPVGLLMYGWCAETRAHWILSDVGILIASGALMSVFYLIQRYTVDTYTKYAASAMAATTPFNSLAGFGFPLFAPALYNNLGYGWGNSVLALLALVIGVPAPWLFWSYGPSLRAKSRYAAG